MRRDDAWTCPQCGEHWAEARSRDSALCQNCANTNSSVPLARCFICLRKNVPGQFHHIASERQHATLGVTLCLNCHSALTHRQETKWPVAWRTEPHMHVARCIVQGMFELVVLWVRRNPGSSSLRELGVVWVRAVCALCESWGFVGWAFD
jgi:hypothetical protein